MGSDSAVAFVDPRTIVLLSGIMGGLMAVVLAFLRRSFPPSVKGLGNWAGGTALLFLGGLAAASRGKSHDLVAITLANFLVFSGLYFQYVGSQRFFDLVPRVARGLWIIVGLTLVSGWYTVVEPNYHLRLLVFVLVMTVVCALHAALIYRQRIRTFAHWFAFVVLLLTIASQVLRFSSSWIYPLETGILDHSPHNLIYISAHPFVLLLFAIGLILLATERVRAEFEHIATHDSLTNALTRRQLTEVCTQELQRCQRHARVMSVLLIDLDHFKAINDSRGTRQVTRC